MRLEAYVPESHQPPGAIHCGSCYWAGGEDASVGTWVPAGLSVLVARMGLANPATSAAGPRKGRAVAFY